MAELADAQDLGSCAARRAGSSPVTRTTASRTALVRDAVFYEVMEKRHRLTRFVAEGELPLARQEMPDLKPPPLPLVYSSRARGFNASHDQA